MTRTIHLARHTDNDGDVLSADGVAAAVALGRALPGGYAVVASSGAQRATQTAGCVLAGLGEHVPGGVVVVPGVRSDREDDWRAAYAEAGGGHLDDFRRVAPELVASESALLADGLRAVLGLLDDGETALVVGHSPTNEAAVLGLADVTIDPMGKGEVVELRVSDRGVQVAPLS